MFSQMSALLNSQPFSACMSRDHAVGLFSLPVLSFRVFVHIVLSLFLFAFFNFGLYCEWNNGLTIARRTCIMVLKGKHNNIASSSLAQVQHLFTFVVVISICKHCTILSMSTNSPNVNCFKHTTENFTNKILIGQYKMLKLFGALPSYNMLSGSNVK